MMNLLAFFDFLHPFIDHPFEGFVDCDEHMGFDEDFSSEEIRFDRHCFGRAIELENVIRSRSFDLLGQLPNLMPGTFEGGGQEKVGGGNGLFVHFNLGLGIS